MKSIRQSLMVLSLGLVWSAGATAAREPQGATRTIEEVIVTARKRAESLQDVPVAVTALDASYIEDNAIGSLEDLVSVVPTFIGGQSQLGAGGAIYLRGVGSATGNALIDQSVAVNLDGVAIAQATLMFAGQYDVNQIEVLRGPQSLFFGKNSTGGVVSFTSADPGSELELEIGGGYEFEAEESFGTLMISGPLGDRVGARVFARYASQEGYYDIVDVPAPVDMSDAQAILGPLAPLFGGDLALPSSADSFGDSTDLFVRGTLVVEPTDVFDIRAKLTYSEREYDSFPQHWQRSFCPLGSPNFLGIPLSVLEPEIDIDDCKFDDKIVTGDFLPSDIAGFTFDGADADGYRNAEIVLGSVEMNYELANGLSLTAISGWYLVDDIVVQDQSNTPTTYLPTGEHTEVDQFTQEVRVVSNWDGPVNFLLGAFYEQRDTDNRNQIPVIGRNGLHRQDQRAYSAFGQLIWGVTERLEASLGARYTDEKKDVESFLSDGSPMPFLIPGSDEIDSDNFSPELTLSYQPNDTLMVYGSYKEGFKSGGFDGGALNTALPALGGDARYDDETVEGYEVGVKAVLLDRTLQLNAAAFTYDYEKLQVTSFDAVAVAVTTVNASGADVDGVEVDFLWQPANVDGLSIRGGGSYLDATYRDFVSNCWTGQSPAAGCNVDVVPGGAFEGLDLSGEEIQRAPELTGTLGFSYERPILGSGLLLNLSADVSYSDSYDVMQQRMPGTRQPSYHKFNASLSLANPDDTWRVALIGRNLNDEILRTVGQNVPLSGRGTGTPAAVPADSLNLFAERGREILLRVTYRPRI